MRPTEITWAGGESHFLLTIDLLRALQQKCDAGPEWILNRLRTGQWLVDDVIQPIRLGLEGGGMAKEAARRLVETHVEDRPLSLSVITAQVVLMSSLYDTAEDDPVGEGQAGVEMAPSHSREDVGSSPASMESAPRSVSEPLSAT